VVIKHGAIRLLGILERPSLLSVGLAMQILNSSGGVLATLHTWSNLDANTGYAQQTFDVTAYKGGVYDRIRPRRPLGKGGMGALQINARYDWLDLNSGAILGGRQQTAGVSMLWMPTDYVRFILQYGHLWLSDAAVPAGVDRIYGADTLGMRAQFDF